MDVLNFKVRFDGVNAEKNGNEFIDKPFLPWGFLPTSCKICVDIGNAKARSKQKREEKEMLSVASAMVMVKEPQFVVYQKKILVEAHCTKFIVVSFNKCLVGLMASWIDSIFSSFHGLKSYKRVDAKGGRGNRKVITVYAGQAQCRLTAQLFKNTMNSVLELKDFEKLGASVRFTDESGYGKIEDGYVVNDNQ